MLATAGSCLFGLFGVQRPPRQILVVLLRMPRMRLVRPFSPPAYVISIYQTLYPSRLFGISVRHSSAVGYAPHLFVFRPASGIPSNILKEPHYLAIFGGEQCRYPIRVMCFTARIRRTRHRCRLVFTIILIFHIRFFAASGRICFVLV